MKSEQSSLHDRLKSSVNQDQMLRTAQHLPVDTTEPQEAPPARLSPSPRSDAGDVALTRPASRPASRRDVLAGLAALPAAAVAVAMSATAVAEPAVAQGAVVVEPELGAILMRLRGLASELQVAADAVTAFEEAAFHRQRQLPIVPVKLPDDRRFGFEHILLGDRGYDALCRRAIGCRAAFIRRNVPHDGFARRAVRRAAEIVAAIDARERAIDRIEAELGLEEARARWARLFEEQDDLASRAAAIPARSLADVIAKATIVLAVIEPEPLRGIEDPTGVLASLFRDLDAPFGDPCRTPAADVDGRVAA